MIHEKICDSVKYKDLDCKLCKDSLGYYLCLNNPNDYKKSLELGFSEHHYGQHCLYIDDNCADHMILYN